MLLVSSLSCFASCGFFHFMVSLSYLLATGRSAGTALWHETLTIEAELLLPLHWLRRVPRTMIMTSVRSAAAKPAAVNERQSSCARSVTSVVAIRLSVPHRLNTGFHPFCVSADCFPFHLDLSSTFENGASISPSCHCFDGVS